MIIEFNLCALKKPPRIFQLPDVCTEFSTVLFGWIGERGFVVCKSGLKVFSVRPTLVWSGLSLLVDTVAWYTTDCFRQLPFMGQSAGFLQLQFLVATFVLFNTDLLWPSMLCLMLDMQL